MTGTEIYKRTPDYEKKAKEIKLLAPHWKVLLAYDGVKTLSEVAIAAEATFAEAIPLTQKFLTEGWIKEEPISLDQYLKRVGMKDISAGGSSVAPAQVLHEPGKPKTVPIPELAKPIPAPAPVTPPPALVQPVAPKPVLPPPASSLAAPTPIAAPPPLPPPASKPAAAPAATAVATAPPLTKSVRAMKLSAIVNFITSLVGNVSLGQLLVYRVFLRVPPELLMAEDIASVHLANDTSLIQTEKLQKAIADAVQAVTKRALPDSVYA